ncbi:lyase family protein [Mycobacterium tuberculosis]
MPAKALWRAQPSARWRTLPISAAGWSAPRSGALGLLKGACAQVNSRPRVAGAGEADAHHRRGRRDRRRSTRRPVSIDVFQTGSGTSSNMNTNEVIASIAARLVASQRRREHVAVVQRHLPTATHIAATEAAVAHLIPALQQPHDALAAKAL